jgi:hypothetical protein
MRKNYLLIAMIALLATGCKKEAKEIMTSQPPGSTYKSVCTGNTWSADQYFDGKSYSPTLVYNNKVYVFNNPGPGDISIFDGTTWTTQVSAIPYTSVWTDYAFVIGNKGYLGFTLEKTDCYEYNFDTNTWTQKTSFPGPRRYRSAFFSVANKGYVVAGCFHTCYSDTWEYNPATNGWTQKAGLPFLFFGRANATGFTIGNKGYIVNGDFYIQGSGQFYLNSLLQYDPSADAWTPKANFPGEARSQCLNFVISGFGYVGAGFNTVNDLNYFKDFYKYNPFTDAWTTIPAVSTLGYLRQSFSINSRGYVTYEFQNNPSNILMEKYTPLSCPPF